jgi:phage shock protein A
MKYQKINIELAVSSEEADAVVTGLNLAIDRLEEKYAIFGGAIDTVPLEQGGARRKSALKHVIDAGDTATSALKLATQKVADAYKRVI